MMGLPQKTIHIGRRSITGVIISPSIISISSLMMSWGAQPRATLQSGIVLHMMSMRIRPNLLGPGSIWRSANPGS